MARAMYLAGAREQAFHTQRRGLRGEEGMLHSLDTEGWPEGRRSGTSPEQGRSMFTISQLRRAKTVHQLRDVTNGRSAPCEALVPRAFFPSRAAAYMLRPSVFS